MAFSRTLLFVSVIAICGFAKADSFSGDASIRLNQPYYPPNADCWEYRVPVAITSENNVFDFPDWTDNYALQDFLTNVTTRPSAGYSSPIVGKKKETASYTLAASLCSPKSGDKKKTVLLATHGIGQARTHWNSAYRPDDFNFVEHAIKEGYSVWFYDSLGTGESEKVSGFINQLRIQRAILVELTKIIKSGMYTGTFGEPQKLIVMGFSFGSYITHFAVAENPTIADGVQFDVLELVYLTRADALVQVNTYFKYPFYDIPTSYYCEEYKQAFAIGEFLTIADGDFDASGYEVCRVGKTDYIICDGECEGFVEEPARSIRSNSKFTPYLRPHASHNFNFHHNATGAFGVITSILEFHGL